MADQTTICVGDVHLKHRFVLPRLSSLMEEVGASRVVFLGDACDDWHASDVQALDALSFFYDWVAEARKAGITVDVLVGNHDLYYLRGLVGPGTMESIFEEVCGLFEMVGLRAATTVANHLCTHAGVTESWREMYLPGERTAEEIATALNALFANPDGWNTLDSVGGVRGGVELPGPLWADRSELLANPQPGISQIVGHTPIGSCLCASSVESRSAASSAAVFASLGTEGTRIVSRDLLVSDRDAKFSTAAIDGVPELWFCDTLSASSNFSPLGDASVLVIKEPNEGAANFSVQHLAEYSEWKTYINRLWWAD